MKIRVGRWRRGEVEEGGVQSAWLLECDRIPQPQGWANLLGVTSNNVSTSNYTSECTTQDKVRFITTH